MTSSWIFLPVPSPTEQATQYVYAQAPPNRNVHQTRSGASAERTHKLWELVHAICPGPKLPPLQSRAWHTNSTREAGPLSWHPTYEKKTNVLQRALKLELFFSLLCFIGSVVTSFLPVLNIPLICSSQALTWNNSLKMNETKENIEGWEMRDL